MESCLEQVKQTEGAQKVHSSTGLTPNDFKQDGVISIQPRKQNWDLKRDVQKKLDKLRKRTDRAILELVRKLCQGWFAR